MPVQYPILSARSRFPRPASHRFGTVAIADGADRGRTVNQGRAHRVPGIDDLSHDVAATNPALAFYHIAPSQLPFSVTRLERHSRRYDDAGIISRRYARLRLDEFHLLKGPIAEADTLYSSHTIWSGRAAFEAWTKSEAFRRAHARAGSKTGESLYLGHLKFEGSRYCRPSKSEVQLDIVASARRRFAVRNTAPMPFSRA